MISKNELENLFEIFKKNVLPSLYVGKEIEEPVTIEKIIEWSLYPVKDTKTGKHDHLYRIPKRIYSEMHDYLLEQKDKLESCNNFEDVLIIVKGSNLIKDQKSLTYYDIADRISYKKGFHPEKIYLHAGTEKGLKNLGWSKKTNSITKSEFESLIGFPIDLLPYQIESFLCIYKDEF
ncbi:hypothetical protein ABID30_003210 [Enterococcus rotai]|uniref:hypothetical protein n=1 Tax=Enterococcus rotai TaxID=118060 RepID=UPI003392B058